VVGDDQPENGVAEELEALVRVDPEVFRAVGPMGERPLEQIGVVEDVTQLLRECDQRR
jgi:hypothetical protein